jgi:hypothetical protein
MNYRNPIFCESGAIDCEIDHPIYGWIPFTASPDDVEAHGRELYAEILEAGGIAPYTPPPPPPPPTTEQLAAQARAERDRLLAASDWTQLPDVPEATRAAWAEYRQALRDVPQQDGFPLTIKWPERPHG